MDSKVVWFGGPSVGIAARFDYAMAHDECVRGGWIVLDLYLCRSSQLVREPLGWRAG